MGPDTATPTAIYNVKTQGICTGKVFQSCKFAKMIFTPFPSQFGRILKLFLCKILFNMAHMASRGNMANMGNMAHTKHQPGKHEASTRQTRSFNPANTKLQPGKHKASTRQTRSFNLANTKLLTSKHEASTWQNEGSTWQTRSFNVANTKLCWMLVVGCLLLTAGG